MTNKLKTKYMAIAILIMLLVLIPSGLTYAVTNAAAKEKAGTTNDPASIAGVTKNETVYAKLSPDGTVSDTTVVNWLHFSKDHPATMEDPAELTNTKALNGSFNVKTDSGEVLISSIPHDSRDLFYSGQTNKELPLKVKISYYLNGKSITPDELAGKTGDVKVVIHLSNQMVKYGKNIGGKTIYTPFMSMISLDLPIDRFSDVTAPDGVVTVVGETMKLNWILFPYPDSDAVLTMHAQDFKLDSISIAALPKMPTLPQVNVEDKLTAMSDGLVQMDRALAQVQNGSQKLAAGQDQMGNGLSKLSQGLGSIKLLNQIEVKLAGGILVINNNLVKGLEPLQSNPVIGEALKPLVEGLEKQHVLLTALVNGGQVEGQTVPPLATTGAKMDEIQTGLDQLTQGSIAAKNGAEQLSNGIGQVRTQGIQKMQAGISASLQEARCGREQTAELERLASSYKTFTGTSANIPCNVQFIIQTQVIDGK